MENLISIITPCFRAEKYLLNTYSSLQDQTHQDWEWLIIDDLSDDNSLQMLEDLSTKDKRVKIFKNEINQGASFSRNVGLDNASGEYIAFLDADDEWFPNKLSSQFNFMKKQNIDFSCHNYLMMTEQGETIKPVRSIFSTVSIENITAFNPIATSFVMIKKSCLGDLRFNLSLRRRQDWVFWFHLIEKVGKAYILKDILGRYRKDSLNSISKNKFKMAQIQWSIYRDYFKLNYFEASIAFLNYAKYGVSKHYLK